VIILIGLFLISAVGFAVAVLNAEPPGDPSEESGSPIPVTSLGS
jgi:hypothetical protein